MKCELYKVPNGAIIKVGPDEPRIPIGSHHIKKEEILYFSHIDGMYSLCYDIEGNVCHLAAFEKVEIVEDFEIIRKLVKRGGRGKDGTEPLKWVPICEMSDEWVAAVIVYNVEHGMGKAKFTEYMRKELKYRKANGISIANP